MLRWLDPLIFDFQLPPLPWEGGGVRGLAIVGYTNFQCQLLDKAVSEPESCLGSQKGGRRPRLELYQALSHQMCD